MSSIQHKFIEFCIESKVLRFGEFKTKAGRLSPYFFNAGLFNTGAMLSKLADFYARTLIKAMEEGRIECDMIFGPAYKGITLAAAVAMRTIFLLLITVRKSRITAKAEIPSEPRLKVTS